MTKSNYNILLVDDHTLFREALIRIIRTIPAVKKVAEAANGIEALLAVKSQPWDLVLLDIEMPSMNGIDTLEAFQKMEKPPPTIVVSMHKRVDVIDQAYALGAKGYLLKESDTAELKLAIETVLNGGEHYTPEVQKILFQQAMKRDRLNAEEPRLTSKELAVLKMICQEKTGKEIAEVLGLSLSTVSTYRRALLMKTRCVNMAGLVKYAYDMGLKWKDGEGNAP